MQNLNACERLGTTNGGWVQGPEIRGEFSSVAATELLAAVI